jgi:hypothetical protein
MSELPSWAQEALNGHSTRLRSLWEPQAGDLLAGEVVERHDTARAGSQGSGYTSLTIRAETGSQQGQPLELGSWVVVRCLSTTLRAWVKRDEPGVGEKVAIHHRGRTRRKLDIAAGVYREEPRGGWDE